MAWKGRKFTEWLQWPKTSNVFIPIMGVGVTYFGKAIKSQNFFGAQSLFSCIM